MKTTQQINTSATKPPARASQKNFYKEAQELMRSTAQSSSSKQGIAADDTIKRSLWDFKEEGEDKWVVINEEMVFKVAMTRDFRTLKNLQLIAKKINMLNGNNDVLRSMTNLQDLNLAGNEIGVI